MSEINSMTNMHRSRPWLIGMAMLLVCAVLLVALLRERFVQNPQYQVSVIGRSELSYDPDTAVVVFGVQVDKAKTADQAITELNERVAKIKQAIIELGVSEQSITTQNYSLYTQYDYVDNQNTVTGYNANQTLTIRLDYDLEQHQLVEQVIAAATEVGVNQINGVTFESSEYDHFKQQARLEAIEDARNNATSMANALGVQLDKVVGWWENSIYPQPYQYNYYGEGYGGGGGSPVIPTGEQKLIMEVNVNYLLK